jgi:Protein of unknown function (DUF3617)
MRISRMTIVVGALFYAGAAPGAAPDVKAGLWERTVTRQMEGPPVSPVADLSKLPPDQRARIEQMLAQSGTTAPTTTVLRYCVTPDSARTWESFARNDRGDASCEATVQDSTPRSARMAVSCDAGKRTGTIEFAAASPDRMTGTMVFVIKEERGDRRIRVDIDSRFVSADCGAVKPETPLQVKG